MDDLEAQVSLTVAAGVSVVAKTMATAWHPVPKVPWEASCPSAIMVRGWQYRVDISCTFM